MLETLRKYKFHLVAGASLFAALIFYSLSLRGREHAGPVERVLAGVTAPAQVGGGRLFGSLRGVWEDYIALVNVRSENRTLLETVKVQNQRLIEANEAVQQNGRLTSLLDLRKSLHARSVAATVVGEDASPWFRTVVIDRGERDGIRDGMPVVAGAGVVG
ncbi:MAG TPA: rod shape-determining protein MreC, partial [Verrucomicrobiae bacterium]|nr:rod shape-determining protein MreC [Verrucomicrobiae bacterium]